MHFNLIIKQWTQWQVARFGGVLLGCGESPGGETNCGQAFQEEQGNRVRRVQKLGKRSTGIRFVLLALQLLRLSFENLQLVCCTAVIFIFLIAFINLNLHIVVLNSQTLL